MIDQNQAFTAAKDLIAKMLETPKGYELLHCVKPGDDAMREIGQRVKALAQALLEAAR